MCCLTGPDLEGGGGALGHVPPPPPDGLQVAFFCSSVYCFSPIFFYVLGTKWKKSLSTVKLWLPDVSNQPFGNGFFGYLYHTLCPPTMFLIFNTLSDCPVDQSELLT